MTPHNRKTSRMEAKFLRRHKKPSFDFHYWHRRVLREMKQSPRVIELVVKGLADRWLK